MWFKDRVQVVCGEYQRYWLIQRVMKNPRFDRESRLMMDLKEPGNAGKCIAVWHFGTALARAIAGVVAPGVAIHVAIVPGHEAGAVSEGLRLVVRNHVMTGFRVCNRQNLLRRHATVPKRSERGGVRNVESVVRSVEVVAPVWGADEAGELRPRELQARDRQVRRDALLLDGALVVLIDDVMTSGSSLEGCCALLEASGAREVISFALMRTAD